MKHRSMRDFFYDKNDIILALIIIIIAALIIWWRMDVIMDYPQTLAQETATTDNETKADDAVDDSKNVPVYTDGKLTKDVKVVVEGGSAAGAVDCLVKADLFIDYNDFAKACKSAGVKVDNIKASTFTFQAGSTPEAIAKQVTK